MPKYKINWKKVNSQSRSLNPFTKMTYYKFKRNSDQIQSGQSGGSNTPKTSNEMEMVGGTVPVNKEPNDTCAIGVKSNNGTCISPKLLQKMAEAYNKFASENNRDKIDVSKDLVKEIERVTEESDQRQWIDEPWVEYMDKESKIQLTELTFSVDGPHGKAWWDNMRMDAIMKQFEESHNKSNPTEKYKFLGCQPRDFATVSESKLFKKIIKKYIPKNGNCPELDKMIAEGYTKFGTIFNLDKSDGGGSHWVGSIFIFDPKVTKIYFADSYAHEPEQEFSDWFDLIQEYATKKYPDRQIDRRHNTNRQQFGDSECGTYSLYFNIKLANGTKTMDDLYSVSGSGLLSQKSKSKENNKLPDELVIQCRKAYSNAKGVTVNTNIQQLCF